MLIRFTSIKKFLVTIPNSLCEVIFCWHFVYNNHIKVHIFSGTFRLQIYFQNNIVWPFIRSSYIGLIVNAVQVVKPIWKYQDLQTSWPPSTIRLSATNTSTVTLTRPHVGNRYLLQLSRVSRRVPRTNNSISCVCCSHSCAPEKNFPVNHPSLIALPKHVWPTVLSGWDSAKQDAPFFILVFYQFYQSMC